MSVWAGWQKDLLSHAALPTTTENIRFLNDWHSHAVTNCANNPIDLSVSAGVGSDCAGLPGLTVNAQKYRTSGDAVHAFDVQIHQGDWSAILYALKSGDPYSVNNTGAVSEQLSLWSSHAWGERYFNETVSAPGRGGPGNETDAFKGWHDLRQSVNKHMPAALHHSEKQMGRALHALGRGRKVKL